MKFVRFTLMLGAFLWLPLMAADFSTPQGALQALERAYLTHDIEAAVAAKNFPYEAKAMLSDLKNVPKPEPDLIQKTAEVLELSFRKHIKENGFPKMTGIRSRVVATKQLTPDLVELTEEFVFPDNYISHETVYAAKSGEHWGLVILPGK